MVILLFVVKMNTLLCPNYTIMNFVSVMKKEYKIEELGAPDI